MRRRRMARRAYDAPRGGGLHERAREDGRRRAARAADKTIRLEWSSDLAMLRVRTCVKPIQCYSLAAMSELQQMLSDIEANPAWCATS